MKISKFYKPSECERNGDPRAFEYELKMFCFTIKEFSRVQGQEANAFLECALLHARNLLDFFTGNQPLIGEMDEKSIRAGQFIRINSWWKSSKLIYLQRSKKNINKALSHLTYDRIGTVYKWDLHKISNEIEAAYNEFVKLLPQEDQGKWTTPAEHFLEPNKLQTNDIVT